MAEETGRRCLIIAGEIGREAFYYRFVSVTIKRFGKLIILVNNAAQPHPQESIADIPSAQRVQTFRTNIFAMFYLTKACCRI